MYTLPVTCEQLATITLCILFAGGIYMMWDTYLTDSWIFTLGVFMTGFPTVIGLACLVWYSLSWLNKNVRCKCNDINL